MKLESLVQFCDEYLGVSAHPDYRTAVNGLQVARTREEPVRRLAAAVDASEAVIEHAARAEVDLLVVHHGLFWEGLRPLTGRRYRKVRTLVDADVALYAVHLPLDAHAEVGNCALLARALGLEIDGRFGRYEGADLGWHGSLAEPEPRERFRERVSAAVAGGAVDVLPGGTGPVSRVAVVTGGGGSFIEEAARRGMDALVTGEGSHHTFVDAMELGIDVYYAGHYATETFGVKALCASLAERFELEWEFLDHPSGM
jgi:dinuclear metal center YbgI/SA1388 family protein